MLDAFIIEKIRRERARKKEKSRHLPLEIRQPPPPAEPAHWPDKRNDENERGSTVIDLSV